MSSFKKCTKKSVLSVALFTAMIVAALIMTPGKADSYSYFFQNQSMDVGSDGWNYVGLYDFTYGSWGETDWRLGDNTFFYTLPYGADFVIMVWDDNSGIWDELVYMYDENR